MLNSRDVNLLRPDVAANCKIWIDLCKAAGLNVLVTSTVRDEAWQRYAVSQGWAPKSATVPTFHSTTAGLAWDFCKNVRGQEYSDLNFFRRCGEIAKKMGFVWGGDWRTPDNPHIQWGGPKGNWSSAQILRGEFPPPMPLYRTEPDIAVLLNGAALNFNVPPQMANGRVMVPVRAIFEAMGASVNWDETTLTATAKRGNTVVVMRIGSALPTVNGKIVPIDQPAMIQDGRTLAPLRFVAEAFGGRVDWDGPSRTARIWMAF